MEVGLVVLVAIATGAGIGYSLGYRGGRRSGQNAEPPAPQPPLRETGADELVRRARNSLALAKRFMDRLARQPGVRVQLRFEVPEDSILPASRNSARLASVQISEDVDVRIEASHEREL